MHSPNRYPIVRAEPIPAAPRPVMVATAYPTPVGVELQNILVQPHHTLQQQQLQVQPQTQTPYSAPEGMVPK
jgi:hypothetical protein